MGKTLTKTNIRGGANASAYVDATENLLSQGETSFPAPIGVVARYQRIDGGLLMENQAGALFVLRFTGPVAGPITGRRGKPTPTFEEAATLGRTMWSSADRIFYSIPGAGLPTGTLPGGLEWSAPPEGAETTFPDGTVDLAGANRGGISLWAIAGLLGAGWFALKS